MSDLVSFDLVDATELLRGMTVQSSGLKAKLGIMTALDAALALLVLRVALRFFTEQHDRPRPKVRIERDGLPLSLFEGARYASLVEAHLSGALRSVAQSAIGGVIWIYYALVSIMSTDLRSPTSVYCECHDCDTSDPIAN